MFPRKKRQNMVIPNRNIFFVYTAILKQVLVANVHGVADAFVVAWLPHTWPKDAKQIPINKGDGKTGLYPYGYGLTY